MLAGSTVNQKIGFSRTGISNDCLYKQSFLEQPHPFVHIFFMAAFVLHQQSCIVATQTV